jgi:hypothetical protein
VASLFQLKEDAQTLNFFSKNSWVRIGNMDFAISLPNSEILLILRDGKKLLSFIYYLIGDEWKSYFRKRQKYPNPKNPSKPSYITNDRYLSSHDDISKAISAWDTWLHNKFGRRTLLRSADWRKLPPTPNQSKMLSRSNISDRDIDRGFASDFITRLMSGSIKKGKQEEKMEKKRISIRDNRRKMTEMMKPSSE